jgi:hypothetical protein
MREGVTAVEGEIDGHPLAPQSLAQRDREPGVIFDNQHPHRLCQGWRSRGDSEVTTVGTVLAPPNVYNGGMRLLGIAALALLAAACGSSPAPSTTNQASKNPAAAAYEFAACMRKHGVSNFPDPRVSTGNGSSKIAQAVPAGAAASPHFKSAQKACQGILPASQGGGPTPAQQQARKRALLAFASCLRTHGVPKFPDPNGQGQLTLGTINAAGVDLHAPAFETAAKACVGVTHGAITLAQVAQAINGPH